MCAPRHCCCCCLLPSRANNVVHRFVLCAKKTKKSATRQWQGKKMEKETPKGERRREFRRVHTDWRQLDLFITDLQSAKRKRRFCFLQLAVSTVIAEFASFTCTLRSIERVRLLFCLFRSIVSRHRMSDAFGHSEGRRGGRARDGDNEFDA